MESCIIAVIENGVGWEDNTSCGMGAGQPGRGISYFDWAIRPIDSTRRAGSRIRGVDEESEISINSAYSADLAEVSSTVGSCCPTGEARGGVAVVSLGIRTGGWRCNAG